MLTLKKNHRKYKHTNKKPTSKITYTSKNKQFSRNS